MLKRSVPLGLPPRLERVAEAVGCPRTLADIGSDHALLPIALVRSGRADRAIAVERVPGPWRVAREAVESAGLADRIDVRMGDGLTPLEPGEADAIAIAGMGSATIFGILAAPEARRILQSGAIAVLVLQPMDSAALLRYFADRAGFSLGQDVRVADGRFVYECLALRPARRVSHETAHLDPSRLQGDFFALPERDRLFWRYGEAPLRSGCRLAADQMAQDFRSFGSQAERLRKTGVARALEKAEALDVRVRALRSLYRSAFGTEIDGDGSPGDGQIHGRV